MIDALLVASATASFVLVSHLGGSAIFTWNLGESPRGVEGVGLGHLSQMAQDVAHPTPKQGPPRTGRGHPRNDTTDPEEPDGSAAVDELVKRAQAGDQAAFATLYEQFYGNVYGNLYAKTRSRVVAEDLASETFIRALRAIASYRSDSRYFGAWLGKIARNLAIDHSRSAQVRSEFLVDDLTRHAAMRRGPRPTAGPLTDVDLQALLHQLPDSQRRCIELRFLLDLPIDETAAYLGVTYGAAKQLQWRALRNLERLLRQELSA